MMCGVGSIALEGVKRILVGAVLFGPFTTAFGAPTDAQPSFQSPVSGPATRWNNQPDFSTAPVRFSLIAAPYRAAPPNHDCCRPMTIPDDPRNERPVVYEVPRNFLVWMDNWTGGPQTLVKLKVAFPDFAPLTESSRTCLLSPPARRPSGCRPIEFMLRRGGADDPPDELRFQNKRDLFLSQEPQRPEGGFDLFLTGPENARINTYRTMAFGHLLIIDCMMDPEGTRASSVCGVQSRLESGNVLEYHIFADQLGDAEKIDKGIRQLIGRFEIKSSP